MRTQLPHCRAVVYTFVIFVSKKFTLLRQHQACYLGQTKAQHCLRKLRNTFSFSLLPVAEIEISFRGIIVHVRGPVIITIKLDVYHFLGCK
jgi:hypothetical protein